MLSRVSISSVIPRTFISLMLFLVFPLSVYAAPSISGTSGTWNHGGSVTINGSAFGTKSPAAPLVWDNASGTSLSQKWDVYWPNGSGASYNMAYRSVQRSVAMPHNRITKYIAGAAYPGTDTNAGWNTLLSKVVNLGSLPKTLYVTHYFRVDPAWVFGLGDPNDHNFKITDLSAESGPYQYPPGYWYWGYAPGEFGSCSAHAALQLQDDLSDSIDGGQYWPGINTPASPCEQWIKWEFETKLSSGSDGYAKVWQDGTQLADYSGKTDGLSGTTRTFTIGGYQRAYGNQNNWRYFADVYMDITPARAMLCTGSTLTSRGRCEPQIPSTWSSSSVTVNVNAGKFADSSTAYLYVCDSTGSCNSNGTAITIDGGGGSDTTSPAAPTGLGV